MEGKTKCEILKALRQRIAEANNIFYNPHPCQNKECLIGTCQICDSELEYLDLQISKREKEGYPVYLSDKDLEIITNL